METDYVIQDIKTNCINVYFKSIGCEYLLIEYPYLNTIFTKILRKILTRMGKKIDAILLVNSIPLVLYRENEEIVFFIYSLLLGICERIRIEYEILEQYEVCFNCKMFFEILEKKINNIKPVISKNLNIKL